jgi:hypothetical protein
LGEATDGPGHEVKGRSSTSSRVRRVRACARPAWQTGWRLAAMRHR